MKYEIKNLILTALFSALIAISAYIIIPIPFSPVPITAQTIIVMLAGSLLSSVHAGTSVLIFLLMGAVGLPVFSKGQSGVGTILGPTGGYLIGFFLAVIAISLLTKNKKNFKRFLTANIIGGVIIIYTAGVLWLSFISNIGIKKALLVGAVPFLPGDILKVILASFLANKLKKYI
ncbi:MAG: biotin transporter BioY [Candidatus Mcinerneyibacterium aminivorans]|jgi:biotin transport system substrate-specific component|uniref:Biotin transporter n=1 Tax=Candidatus Mcinerneyibacterium aminivorans TaxID=2703815 RepID=A0A5D0MCT9_9BACT|nr:MAG: biotin transporter BioY [Candidatus Mcinerneyibacterium aminivorans]